MRIEIKIINDEHNLHVFNQYSLDTIKDILNIQPKILLDEIERMEKQVHIEKLPFQYEVKKKDDNTWFVIPAV